MGGFIYLSDRKADEFPSRSEMLVVTSDDGEHQSTHEEALNLDPTTAQDLDEIDCEEVPRDVACCRNDQVAVCVLEQSVVLGLSFGESNGGKQDRLIEIEAIEGDIYEEPC